MGDALIQILKWVIRLASFSTVAGALLIAFQVMYGALNVILNYEIIADGMGMIQMWTPFNLGSVFAWLITASTIYFAWRFAVIAFDYITRMIGTN